MRVCMCARASLNLKAWMWWKPMKSHHNFPRVFVYARAVSFLLLLLLQKSVYTQHTHEFRSVGRVRTAITKYGILHTVAWTNSYFMAIKRQHNLCLRLKTFFFFFFHSQFICHLQAILSFAPARAHSHSLAFSVLDDCFEPIWNSIAFNPCFSDQMCWKTFN